MREVRTQFPRGKVVRERYIVEELLGQGGFGAVYRVRDRRVRDNVFALKEVIDPNRQQRENFLFEGEVLRRLDHRYLPRVYRAFEDEKHYRLYMLMDYIAGPNLERLRHQQPEKRFSLSQTFKIMAPIIEAVEYLHAQQPPIIHRDIKPSNIIVLASGEGTVLVDFGIAKEYDEDSTTTAIRHCSPGYGAPEQYVHGTTTQTDIYGLGATFYTLLTGEVPIDALYRITRMSSRGVDPLQSVTDLVPTLPQGLAEVLRRAMAISVQDRFPTVQEFWEALGVYEEEDETTADQEKASSASVVAETPPPPVLAPVPDTPAPSSLAVADSAAPLIETHTTAVQPPRQLSSRRNKILLASVVALALLALLSGVMVAFSGNLTGTQAHTTTTGTAISSTTARHQITPTSVATATATPTTGPTATSVPPTPTRQASPPTKQPVTYPSVASSYSGTIHNQPADVDSTMSLTQVQQTGANIQGSLSMGAGLLGDGAFTGSVGSDGTISFTHPMGDRYLPLYFSGQFQADGSIKGTYCSYSGGSCDYNGGGYGSWSASPTIAQAQTSSGRGKDPSYPVIFADMPKRQQF